MKQRTALFLTTGYLNLDQPIIEELQNQGYVVTVIKDCLLEGDPKLRSTPLRNFAKRFIRLPKHITWQKRAEQHWATIYPSLAEHYNLFICLSAFTIPPSALKTLKSRTDHTVLYVWDSSAIWDFSIIAPYFEAAYTFDLRDSERHPILRLLPNYFISSNDSSVLPVRYSAIMVGTNHNERIKFLYSLAGEFDRHGKSNYFFKLMPHSLPRLSQRLCHLTGKSNDGRLERFELREPIPLQEYMRMMEQSEIIVDDSMPRQSGLTPRFIWGLSRGKKIITTNRYAHAYDFVAPENVLIVDRKHPVIPADFLTAPAVPNPSSLSSLEIKQWVSTLITPPDENVSGHFFKKPQN